jgi:hypothetical protein
MPMIHGILDKHANGGENKPVFFMFMAISVIKNFELLETTVHSFMATLHSSLEVVELFGIGEVR